MGTSQSLPGPTMDDDYNHFEDYDDRPRPAQDRYQNGSSRPNTRRGNGNQTYRGQGNCNGQRSSAYNQLQTGRQPRMNGGGGGHYGNRRNIAGSFATPSPYVPVGHANGESGHVPRETPQHKRRSDDTESDNSKRKFDGPVFGFKRLFNFLSAPTDNVLNDIGRNLKDWEKLLDQDSLSCIKTLKNGRSEKSDDLLYIIVQLLGEKICVDNTVQTTLQNSIVSSTMGSTNFLNKVDDKIKSYQDSGLNRASPRFNQQNEYSVVQDPVKFFRCLLVFFRFVSQKMRTTALDFLQKVVPSVRGTLAIINMEFPSEEVSALFNEAQDLFQNMKSIQDENARKVKVEEVKSRRRFMGLTAAEEDLLHSIPPPDNFRDISTIPSVDEIRSDEDVFLRTNKTTGAYNDADHYLDVQFRLLREDFVRPLRTGILDFLQNKEAYLSKKKRPPIGNVRLYPKVRYADIKLNRGVAVNYLQLHPDNYKKVKWDKSKRLLSGTLLVLTTDDFNSAFFATVQQRNENELKEGKLAVMWEGESPHFDKEVEYMMIECEVYFEAYRYTLQVLQQIELQRFPMAKFIVEASNDVRAPRYLQDNRQQITIGNHTLSPLYPYSWPNARALGLDERQFEAFRACLTKEFAIVQGPPGTGKTFLALQVVEVFLRNLEMWHPDDRAGPILIVCYTNHALDQFLEGVLKVFERLNQTPKIVRVGGRSKTAALDEFSLNRLRQVDQKVHRDPNYQRMKNEAHRTLRQAEDARQSALSEFSALNNAEGIVVLENLNTRSQLLQEIPEKILKKISSPSWFGLDTAVVGNTAPENFLRRHFTVLQTAQNSHPNGRTSQGAAREREVKENTDSEEEDEDYDVDELEGNRVVEDMYAEVEAIAAKAPAVSCKLMFDDRERELQQKHDSLEAAREKAKENELVKLYMEIISVDREIKLLDTKKEICKAVLAAYGAKSLQLPDVDHLFEDDYITEALPIPFRWAIYFHVLERAKELTALRVKEAGDTMTEAQKRWQEVLRLGDGRILGRSLIVGMTTTGAAKYNDLLRMTQSRIVLVEEAAEVLESHIVTCITPACQHLILIGDHQQLRPSTTVYDLAKKYHLDISLFERMVNNQLNCYKINMQHRMRPEIADLVVGTIYPELLNAPSVYNYPPVTGVTSNLFFIDHKHKESAESDSKSKSNEHEAKFMAALCRYLIQNGYSPQQITVLTTYTGQMFLIKQKMRSIPTCNGARVTCVDNFQGEENDIILLSLVRSNDKGSIGFLKTDNRICVAVSRAKHGLFIIGNMSQLVAERTGSKTWRMIEEKLKNAPSPRIGPSIIIQCQVHGTVQSVSDDKEFSRLAPEGGCNQSCDAELACGHNCQSVCHIQDREHAHYECKARCEKRCSRGHQCKAYCFRPCPSCVVKVTKALPCGHEKVVECHAYASEIKCYVIVQKKLPCGHEDSLACHVNPAAITCHVKVMKDLPCGHKKEAECHVDAAKITCGVMVDNTLPCGHVQKEKCFKWEHPDTIKCETKVEVGFKLCEHKVKVLCSDSKNDRKCQSPCSGRPQCGHACRLICHKDEDPDHIHYKCTKPCARKCENGEHRCSSKHQCHKVCPPCQSVVKKLLPCLHEQELKCYQDPLQYKCEKACNRTMDCGHKCENKCFEACGPCKVLVTKRRWQCGHEQEMPCSVEYTASNCEVEVKIRNKSDCTHDVYVPCRLSASLPPEDLPSYCTEKCKYKFDGDGDCGHSCQGTCGSCLQGRVHKKCQEKCGKVLVCGHTCDVPCSQSCPPCEKPCLMTCEHSTCTRKCGVPCDGCVERCGWKCPHKSCTKLCSDLCDRDPCDEPCPKTLPCGHDCIGFCGEPCPPQCRVCDREELTEFILYGFEEDDDARFVLLEDCGHAIEVQGLTYVMEKDINNGEITPKRCPRCLTLIRKSRRYGNILKTQLEDIIKVKKHKFGNVKETGPQVKALALRVMENYAIEVRFKEMKKFLIEKLVSGLTSRNLLICKKVDVATLSSLEAIAHYVAEAAAVFDDKPDVYEDPKKREHYRRILAGMYEKLFDNLRSRHLPLSKQELNDFEWEFARLFDLNQIHRSAASSRFNMGNPRAKTTWDRLMNLINYPKPYDEKRKAKVHELLEELNKELATGLGISDRERLDILKAFGLREGRWFKCPNGHVYVITECGGAMEEGTCNECGARIGGGSHRLRADNALATEMDGATQPLYPNMI